MTNWHARIRALRALGAEGSGATEHERILANEKADELEAKYGTPVTESSSFTDHTTTRTQAEDDFFDFMERLRAQQYQREYSFRHVYYSQRYGHGSNEQPPNYGDYRPHAGTTVPPSASAWEEVNRLFKNQYKWNDKYYDKDGNPRPQEADEDAMYAEGYKYDPTGEDQDYYE